MEQLAGRTAVVTGGGSGIGLALAQALVAEGMRVVVADVDAAAASAAAKELDGRAGDADGTADADGQAALAVVADVRDRAAVEELARRAEEAFGPVHLLVNNAGVGSGGVPLWETTANDWAWVSGVNLMGVVHGIQAFVPRMLAHGEPAHIVNTASLSGLVTFPLGGPYGSLKTAVVALSEQLLLELRAHDARIGVSALCPAWVKTRILESERLRPEELQDHDDRPHHLVEQIAALMEATGLEPEVVAAQTVEAVRADRFWVLPNPEWNAAIVRRGTAPVEGRTPDFPMPTRAPSA